MSDVVREFILGCRFYDMTKNIATALTALDAEREALAKLEKQHRDDLNEWIEVSHDMKVKHEQEVSDLKKWSTVHQLVIDKLEKEVADLKAALDSIRTVENGEIAGLNEIIASLRKELLDAKQIASKAITELTNRVRDLTEENAWLRGG